MPRSMNTDGLHELLWSFASHRALTCASRTGLLDALRERWLNAESAARELSLSPGATAKILRALADLGVLDHNAAGEYTLGSAFTAAAGAPSSLAPFLDHSHHLYDSWGESLETWLKGGTWARVQRDTDGIRQFSLAMSGMAKAVAPQLVAALDLSGVRRAIDFGGNVGEYARALCRANAEVHVTVVDIPTVAAIGASELEDELSERIEFLGGDYIEADCGGGYDLSLLINVVHQETPERAQRLIAAASRPLAPGGRLAILDFALAKDGGSPLGALFALNMREFGDTYDASSLVQWMHAAGLVHVQKTAIGQHRMLLVGHKPH